MGQELETVGECGEVREVELGVVLPGVLPGEDVY